MSQRCLKSVIEAEQKHKPREIIQSNQIEVKLTKRKSKSINKDKELQMITENEIIIDYVIKYVKSQEKKEACIASINQVQLFKRMHLPCKLVSFDGNETTKEAGNREDKSSVIWKFELDAVSNH